jgi:hypothetical protein
MGAIDNQSASALRHFSQVTEKPLVESQRDLDMNRRIDNRFEELPGEWIVL